MSRHVLNREFLLSGRLAEEFRRWNPEVRLLSDEERGASLRAMLDGRPEPAGQGVWVFAYGSLIWNPMVEFVQREVAHAPGWRRSFCLASKGGRGTPENPGLMLGLRPNDGLGGGCTGVALRIAEDLLGSELDLIWRREMVARGYIPRWVALQDRHGRAMGHGIAFTSDPEGPGYCGDLCEEEVVRRLATARGRMGTAAEYLYRTRDGLRELGIRCAFVERIAGLVDAEMAARAAAP